MKCVGVVSDCTYTHAGTHTNSPLSLSLLPLTSLLHSIGVLQEIAAVKRAEEEAMAAALSVKNHESYIHTLNGNIDGVFFSDQACFLQFIFGGSLVSRGKFLCESYICKNQLSILWICVQDQPTFL